MRAPPLAAVPALLICLAVGRADDTKDDAARQKKTVLANLKKMEVAKPASQETENLIVAGAIPDAKARSLAGALQKQYATTYKALKFEANDPPWKGKLAVYVFPDRSQYLSFVRQVEQRRPEAEESATVDVRTDDPHIALTTPKGSTSPAAIDAEAASQVAVALLSKRGGVSDLPGWFKAAFARAVQMRTDPRVGNADRGAVRKIVASSKSRPMPVKPSDGWMGEDEKEKGLIAASVVEYLVFGPESAKFPQVLAGFRESEENRNPSMDGALKAAGFTPEGLDKAWKKWVQTGR